MKNRNNAILVETEQHLCRRIDSNLSSADANSHFSPSSAACLSSFEISQNAHDEVCTCLHASVTLKSHTPWSHIHDIGISMHMHTNISNCTFNVYCPSTRSPCIRCHANFNLEKVENENR